jgi:type III pantothenate kinase
MTRRRSSPARSPEHVLAVDVGNTSATVGVFRGDELVAQWGIASTVERTADEIAHLIRGLAADRGVALAGPLAGVVASVVPAMTREFSGALVRLGIAAPLVVDHTSDLGIRNRYRDPSAVGPDRLANAAAARAHYGVPAVIVDLGTATTFDVVSARGEYLGGAIAPGLVTSADVLFRRAARLQRIELALPARAVGRTTEESIRSGIVLGNAILIDGLVARIAAEIGAKPLVIATGGYVDLVQGIARSIQIVDPALTLKGLLLAHRRQARRARPPASPRRPR